MYHVAQQHDIQRPLYDIERKLFGYFFVCTIVELSCRDMSPHNEWRDPPKEMRNSASNWQAI